MSARYSPRSTARTGRRRRRRRRARELSTVARIRENKYLPGDWSPGDLAVFFTIPMEMIVRTWLQLSNIIASDAIEDRFRTFRAMDEQNFGRIRLGNVLDEKILKNNFCI